ncbi:MAG: DRTGG domain-containing protein [Bacteroidales bacterium]
MKIQKINELLNAEVVCGEITNDCEIAFAFASDLMSEVLTIKKDGIVLLTGLCTIQAIRTAEMSDIHCIIFVRGKKVSEEMIELAKENNIILLECQYSMFKTSGILFSEGVQPVY